ncbi:hypothetical protein GCM10009766_07880 [Microcella frigidaquae]
MLKHRGHWNKSVQETKETPAMTALLVIIALLAAAPVVSTVVVASRDGYRRVPAIERY